MPDETYKLPEKPAYRAGSIRKLRDTDLADSCQTFNPLVEGILESVEYLNQNKAGLHEDGKIAPGELPTNVPNGVAGLDGNGKVPAAQLPEMDYVPSDEKGQANGVAQLDASGKVPENQLPVQGGVVAQNTAPANPKLAWIDTGHNNILKFYDAASKTWKPVGAAWG